MKDKNRMYNLLDIKEAVQIKPSDYSKTINTKEFQFVQKPKDGMANYDKPSSTARKGKRGLRSKYDLASPWRNDVLPERQSENGPTCLLWSFLVQIVQVDSPTKVDTSLLCMQTDATQNLFLLQIPNMFWYQEFTLR